MNNRKSMNQSSFPPVDPLDENDKVAIVGIGCRYGDGVAGPLEMWRMLKEMRDCTTSHPAERFDKSTFFFPGEKKKGKLYTKRGGYLKQDPFMFDRQFFRMSPSEAEHMDPQIRILLEVVWESIEDAGIPASTLRGSNTGVYMGVTANEYLALTGLPFSNIGQYTNSGTNSCMISNRISYEFDLRGPSFSIDTACSSSLYAVQVACDALRGGVCDTAIAGGVNIILTPSVTIGFCQAGMLSPDGQCKSFDESADGYSRSEGVGSVLLKPLKRAIADNDRIYAVIRGGALTNDGRTPGIANPSFDAQIDLVHKACSAAKVDPRDVAYIEAHGTGTRVGDKTEANAIGEAMSKQRSDDAPPLYIGSVKSNVGHAEGAAGIAGVIKTALLLYHREIPGVVHFQRGNPSINFEDLKMTVPSTSISWPADSKYLAGCSSFGFGGANAHVVFEAAPSTMQNHCEVTNGDSSHSEKSNMLMLSASTSEALKQKFIDYGNFISQSSVSLKNTLYTANLRTHNHVFRAVLLAKTREEFMNILQRKVHGENVITLIEGKAPEGNVIMRLVFVFSGMGTQWWGMARELMNTQPIFQKTMQRIDSYLGKIGGRWSLIQILTEETDKNRISKDTEMSQVCICSVQIGLVELYKLYGVTPSAIIGHSVGEVAAAYAAGLLSMENAVKVIYKRGHLLRKTSGSGTMAAVLHDVDVVKSKLESTPRCIDVAAVNSPTQIVLSGKAELINEFASQLNEDGILTKLLRVNNAFHSRHQEGIKEEFLKKTRFLKKKTFSTNHRPVIPMMSTVTNRYVTLQEANDPAYWWSNIRQKVRFRDAVDAILKDGYNSFLEIGAHPALSPAIKDIVASKLSTPMVHFITHSLKRPRDVNNSSNDNLNFNLSLAQMFVRGYPIDMTPSFLGSKCEVESLPLYPWQRTECSAATSSRNEIMRYPNSFHPLLGKPDTSANFSLNEGFQVWKGTIGTHEEPWIADHVVQGSVVFPAAGFIETAIAAHQRVFSDSLQVIIKDMRFDRFMFVSDEGTTVETTTELETEGTATFRFCSLNTIENKWTRHTTMTLINTHVVSGHDICLTNMTYLPVSEIRNRCHEELDQTGFYAFKKQVGFNLGESFMCIEMVNYNKLADEALFYIRAPDTVAAQSSRFYIHPALLDGILQAMAGLERLQNTIINPTAKPEGRVPRSIERSCFKKGIFPESVYLHFKLMSDGGADVYADVSVAIADTLEVIAMFSKIRFGSVAGRSEDSNIKIWNKEWVPIDMGMKSFDPTGYTLITGNDKELSLHLQNHLTSAGLECGIYNGGDVQEEQLSMGGNKPLLHIIITIKPGDKRNHDKLSRKNFLELQSSIAEMCINHYKALSTQKNIDPKIWLITRDGFYVTHDDVVDPCQASAYGFGICAVQENLDFKLSILDIPSGIINITTADWLLKYIWGSDNDEIIIALRKNESSPTTDFNVYVYRLCIRDSYHFPCKQSSSKWKFNVRQSFETGRLLLTKFISDKEETNSVTLTIVNIESFQLLSSETQGSSKEVKPIVLFCGNSEKSSLVIGVCSSNEMKSTIQCSNNELLELETNLPPTHVIDIVSSYTVPFLTVRDLKPDGATLVCIDSTEDKQCLAVAHVAEKMGHNVLIVIKHFPEKHSLASDAFPRFIESTDVMSVLNGHSVGCVIGYIQCIRELIKVNEGLKDRLTTFAKVEILKSKEDIPVTDNLGLSRNVRVVVNSYTLPLLCQFHKMKPTFNSLLNLFKEPPSAQKYIKSPHIKLLKEVNTRDKYAFDDVIFSVENHESVRVNYDFSGRETRLSMRNYYIVTGGTTGFGLRLVEWLVDNGAGHIAILSRSVPSFESEKILRSLTNRGIEIVHIRTDITNRSDIENAFATVLKDRSKTLRGIFHCAAQYDDRLIESIEPDSWKRVIATKSWGALLLHQTSIKFNVQLEYFVMISSVVQLVGNTGQASYCAANTYLSSLGHYRRNQGLPATVICPGVIGDTGFAARVSGIIEFWERRGIESVTSQQVLNLLDVLLSSNTSDMGVTGNLRINDVIMEYRGILKHHDYEASSMMLGFSSTRSLGQNENACDIMHLKPDEAKLYIFQQLCSFISKRIGLTGDISPNSAPSSLGVDSLTATELSGDIQRTFFVPFPSMELINANATMQSLSILIYRKILDKNEVRGQQNSEEEIEEDTSWKAWYIMDEMTMSPIIQLICFPPNGGGPSVYAWWQEKLSKNNVQLIMAQLPGWEGRHNEKPLQNLEEIVSKLTENLAPRLLPGRFILFGHSIGGLIAFEVAHLLKTMGLQPAHMIISSWYAPTLDYPNSIELSKGPVILKQIEQDINNNIPVTNKSPTLSFVDDDVLGNPDVMRRLIPCFNAGFKICQKYNYTHSTKLQCGMTVFGAKSDRFIPPNSLDAWCHEIDENHHFKKIMVPGGHMHIRKRAFFRDIQKALKDTFQ
ncbi:phenolphthiocerol/phthiocerol polyketide synthase subunit C-like [Antedon mediterranea]|uniref:phenolphthiocerol/phthiocerol polyketide synthase subunit C-like n=1 Tax=Antedon mediterranea TaxID=105859 RepID=UPI003AF7A0F5